MAKLLNIKKERQRGKRERERKIETISNNKQKNSPKKRNRGKMQFFFSLTRWPSLKYSFLKTDLGS